MDAFFASIEEKYDVMLKNIPMVVARGVILTANYKAREYGIKSAMSTKIALLKYPNLKIVEPRMNLYKQISNEIQKYISENFNVIEFVSLDEGYLDITNMIKNIYPNYTKEILEKFIFKLKKRIFEKVGLTCSIGIGFSKISAKIASDINKPNGYHIFINKYEFNNYVFDKNLRIIPGIGKKTQEILNDISIYTVKDLLLYDKNKLYTLFNINRVNEMYELVKGNSIKHYTSEHSISFENTFSYEENDINNIYKEFYSISKRLWLKIEHMNSSPKTISIKIKYSNLNIITKNKTIDYKIKSYEEIYEIAKQLFITLDNKIDIKLVGINLSNFSKLTEKNTLF